MAGVEAGWSSTGLDGSVWTVALGQRRGSSQREGRSGELSGLSEHRIPGEARACANRRARTGLGIGGFTLFPVVLVLLGGAR
jgi:hypothetical protein